MEAPLEFWFTSQILFQDLWVNIVFKELYVCFKAKFRKRIQLQGVPPSPKFFISDGLQRDGVPGFRVPGKWVEHKLNIVFLHFFSQIFGIPFWFGINTLKNHKIWQKFGKKWRQALFNLPLTHFFGWFWVCTQKLDFGYLFHHYNWLKYKFFIKILICTFFFQKKFLIILGNFTRAFYWNIWIKKIEKYSGNKFNLTYCDSKIITHLIMFRFWRNMQ